MKFSKSDFIRKTKRAVEAFLAERYLVMPRHSEILKDKDFRDLYHKYKNYTMCPIERLDSLYKSVKYIIDHKIGGDFVECGVWKGGSAMVMAHTLKLFGDTDRKIYLYDTYEGMSNPTDMDTDFSDRPAMNRYKKPPESVKRRSWFEEVKERMYATGYPQENLVFVKGKVEETIPRDIPQSISLLRLDTDWYESTRHELEHLFPLLSLHGVLIIDDYGEWKGSRKAVDEYFAKEEIKILLNRTDYSQRIAIKV